MSPHSLLASLFWLDRYTPALLLHGSIQTPSSMELAGLGMWALMATINATLSQENTNVRFPRQSQRESMLTMCVVGPGDTQGV